MPENPRKPATIHLETLGCKVNQYESESLRGDLIQTGRFTAAADGHPDLVIINTCSVTKKAAMQSRQMIRRAVRAYPNAVIIATGCLAQTEPAQLAEIQGIDYIIGNTDKTRVPEILGSGRPLKNDAPVIIRNDIRDQRSFAISGFPATGARSRPFIKIQDGCDQFCTYCIVPYARGPSRSRPLEDIALEISGFSEKGCCEAVLTGIHVGRWGLDLSPPSDLHALLSHIHENDLIHRIRLSSIEPLEVTDALLSFAADSHRICPHWHIPLQSGDETVLKNMHRPYSPYVFSNLAIKIRNIMPLAAIGADVMVGFPGETDDAFERTLSLIDSLPLTYLHVFPFSRREPAPAARFSKQIPREKITSRAKALSRLGLLKKAAFYDKMLGKNLNVIIESRRDPATGMLTGVSENYVRVMIDGEDALKNSMVRCRIIDRINPGALLGKTA